MRPCCPAPVDGWCAFLWTLFLSGLAGCGQPAAAAARTCAQSDLPPPEKPAGPRTFAALGFLGVPGDGSAPRPTAGSCFLVRSVLVPGSAIARLRDERRLIVRPVRSCVHLRASALPTSTWSCSASAQNTVAKFARHGPKTSFSYGRVAAGLQPRARASEPSHRGHALETQQRRCKHNRRCKPLTASLYAGATQDDVPPRVAGLALRQEQLVLPRQEERRPVLARAGEPDPAQHLQVVGLCNDKAIDINLDEDGKIVMALKAPKRATKPSKSLNKTPLRKNFRRSAKAIQSQTAGKFYRGDLTGKALARYAALHRFTKVQQGLAKKAKTKTGRRGAVGDDDEGMPSLTVMGTGVVFLLASTRAGQWGLPPPSCAVETRVDGAKHAIARHALRASRPTPSKIADGGEAPRGARAERAIDAQVLTPCPAAKSQTPAP